ncbi:MAG: hypothetical protein Aurels2KO_56540 [Aureliella sp.]
MAESRNFHATGKPCPNCPTAQPVKAQYVMGGPFPIRPSPDRLWMGSSLCSADLSILSKAVCFDANADCKQ